MPIDDNKALLRRFFEELVNQGNIDVADQLVAAEGFEPEGIYPGTPAYREGVKRYFTMLRSAFPDLRVTVEDAIAEDNKVVFLTRWEGTHQGPYLGIPATGKQVAYAEVVIAHIHNGKITKHIAIADDLDVMQQLGVTRLPEQPEA